MQKITFTGNRKVLWQTASRRKRKLSNYRSKIDMYKKKHRVISQRNIGFKQNYIKVENYSSDEDVEVVNCNSDPECHFALDSSTDGNGFDHLPRNVENTDWEFVSNNEENK